MNATIDEITETVLSWPVDKRAILNDRLLESLHTNDDPKFREDRVAEIRRRVAGIVSGQAETIPGEVAMEVVRNSLRK